MGTDTPKSSGTISINKRKKILKRVLSWVMTAVILFAVLLEFLTLTEYRPDDYETAAVDQFGREPLSRGESLRVLTWNCGYGALGDEADFFMDGGKGVHTADKETVLSNLEGIVDASAQMEPDVIFYQEIDESAARSHHINEEITMLNEFIEKYDQSYSSGNAYNFNAGFVPYPIPPLGDIRSGLLTLTLGMVDSAERVQLPCPFKWPVRMANYKRCLLVERLPLQNTDKQLVLVNLHLEAYDHGEGRAQQTKMLAEILAKEAADGNYVIAGGDFDQTFSGTDLSAYPLQEGMWAPGTVSEEEFGEGWQCLMDSSAPTCRSLDKPLAGADAGNFQYYVIDGFVVSSNIEVLSCETKDLGFVNTDHNPVLMECRLK